MSTYGVSLEHTGILDPLPYLQSLGIGNTRAPVAAWRRNWQTGGREAQQVLETTMADDDSDESLPELVASSSSDGDSDGEATRSIRQEVSKGCTNGAARG